MQLIFVRGLQSKHRNIHKFDYAGLPPFSKLGVMKQSIIANSCFSLTITDDHIIKEKALIVQIFTTSTQKVNENWKVQINSWTSAKFCKPKLLILHNFRANSKKNLTRKIFDIKAT